MGGVALIHDDGTVGVVIGSVTEFFVIDIGIIRIIVREMIQVFIQVPVLILILFFPDVIYFLLRVDKSILLIIRISCCGFALIPRLPRVRC